jgi:DNA-binding transcriptional MocR family regulator
MSGTLPPPVAPEVQPDGLPTRRGEGSSLSEQLAQHYGRAIRQQMLTPGNRLPSVREAARRHRVSPHTVVAAYDLLQAQGLVEARRQRGFFVRASDPLSRTGAASIGQRVPPLQSSEKVHPVDASALIRGMLAGTAHPQAPGLGILPEDWLDAQLLQSALRRVLAREGGRLAVGYGDPMGDLGLRQALSHRLADLGIPARSDQILCCAGATHGLDLVGQALLQPGDAVLVDEPGWAVEYARLTHQGIRLLSVPRQTDGPDLACMEALALAHRPKAYFTVSVLHNPTGACLSLGRAHQLLRLAERFDLMVVEDDSYAYLAPPHAPRLSALDGLQRSVYVSGFSKVLAPGWRVGFLASPPKLLPRLLDCKLLGHLTTPALLERALAHCLDHGLLRRHAERLVIRLEAARSRSVRLAEQASCRFRSPPQGLFGWLDCGVDTGSLAAAMLDEGWLLAPGSLFMPDHRSSTCMRINFATSQDRHFWDALEATRARLGGKPVHN